MNPAIGRNSVGIGLSGYTAIYGGSSYKVDVNHTLFETTNNELFKTSDDEVFSVVDS